MTQLYGAAPAVTYSEKTGRILKPVKARPASSTWNLLRVERHEVLLVRHDPVWGRTDIWAVGGPRIGSHWEHWGLMGVPSKHYVQRIAPLAVVGRPIMRGREKILVPIGPAQWTSAAVPEGIRFRVIGGRS